MMSMIQCWAPGTGTRTKSMISATMRGAISANIPLLPNAVTSIPIKMPMKGLMYPKSRLVRSQSEGSYSEIKSNPYRV